MHKNWQNLGPAANFCQNDSSSSNLTLSNHTTILFDAVSTVIYPEPNVYQAYHRHGAEFGSSLTIDQVKSRFQELRQQLFDSELNESQIDVARSELVSSDQIEFDLWRCLVEHLFTDVDDSMGLFHRLWGHFSLCENWRVYEDVEACWSQLRKQGYQIGIASNFDSRLLSLCRQLPPLDSVDFVACSAKVGYRKPDPRFYQSIMSAHPAENFIMIGDDKINDYLAPQSIGWQSFLIDRTASKNHPNVLRSLSELDLQNFSAGHLPPSSPGK